MNNSKVCKTFIRRFDPGPRLQSSPLQIQYFGPRLAFFYGESADPENNSKTANSGRSAFVSLPFGLPQSLPRRAA